MKKICVYCGSSAGYGKSYLDAAFSLGRELARRKIGLIYGGASVGVMGQIADSVLEAGGNVTGVLPKGIFRQEIPHSNLTDMIEVATMHERKSRMAELADGFIALPGGLGTLEELFEILTWAQLRIHAKPVGLLNVESYFSELFDFLDHAVSRGFILQAHRDMIITSDSPELLLNKLKIYEAPDIEK